MTKQSTSDFDFGTIVAIIFSFAVGILALPVVAIWVLATQGDKSSKKPVRYNDPDDVNQTQAEIDASVAFDEGSLLHQHYEMNGTIVQGLKDPEW